MASNESSQPNLSQYFGNASEPPATAKEEFFDNFHDAMMQSCRESKIDLTGMDRKKATPPVEAEIVVTAQVIKVRWKFNMRLLFIFAMDTEFWVSGMYVFIH